MNAKTRTDLSIFRRLFLEARPYWPHLGAILLLDLLAAPLALLTPVPLKIVVDSVVAGEQLPALLSALLPNGIEQRVPLLTLAVGLLLLTTVLMQFQQLSGDWLKAYTGGRMVLDFRNLLFSHGQRLKGLGHH